MFPKVLIAGAGVLGLTAAWKLASAGATVELVDPRPPGRGATLAALAALWPASPLKISPLHVLNRQSLSQFESFARELSAFSELPVTYRRLGRIEILNSPKALTRAHEEVAASPTTLSVIDYQTAKSQSPGLAPFAHGALRCTSTAQVHITELIAALVHACKKLNVTFHQRPVTDLLHDGQKITALRTPAGPFHADAFLITAGAWTPTLSPLLQTVAPVRPAKGQGVAVPMPASKPITTLTKSGPIYLIPWDEEILIGSTTEPEAQFDETPTPAAKQKLLAGAAAILPELATAKVLRHWAGLRPQNPIKPHNPIIGPHPEFKNLFLNTAHYKTGIALAPLTSTLITQALLENKIPPQLLPFVPTGH